MSDDLSFENLMNALKETEAARPTFKPGTNPDDMFFALARAGAKHMEIINRITHSANKPKIVMK